MLASLKQHWDVLGKTGSSDTSASSMHFLSLLLHHSPSAWVKNYCIWCNLMDCWTVNMLDSQTAVSPRVKSDGWAGGSRGTYGNDQAWKERAIFCAFVSLTSDHTDAFVCFSFVSLLADVRQRLRPRRTRLINALNFFQVRLQRNTSGGMFQSGRLQYWSKLRESELIGMHLSRLSVASAPSRQGRGSRSERRAGW